ncbi:MAG: GNAT family N-acetyltransferase [Pseudomonadota bacterium]
MSAAPDDLFAALFTTWPGAELHPSNSFVLRRSAGGGNRVRAATWTGKALASDAAIAQAAATMNGWNQPALFLVQPAQQVLDNRLSALGYTRRDPTILMAGKVAPLLDIATPRLSTFEVWPPLAIMDEIWDAGGIGRDRRAIMTRCAAPKTAIFGREDNRPTATAFAAAMDTTAMVHALEVRPERRRRGVARRVMARAAQWAARQGCDAVAVAVTEANAPAIRLYSGLGLRPAAHYHYRCLDGERP